MRVNIQQPRIILICCYRKWIKKKRGMDFHTTTQANHRFIYYFWVFHILGFWERIRSNRKSMIAIDSRQPLSRWLSSLSMSRNHLTHRPRIRERKISLAKNIRNTLSSPHFLCIFHFIRLCFPLFSISSLFSLLFTLGHFFVCELNYTETYYVIQTMENSSNSSRAFSFINRTCIVFVLILFVFCHP